MQVSGNIEHVEGSETFRLISFSRREPTSEIATLLKSSIWEVGGMSEETDYLWTSIIRY